MRLAFFIGVFLASALALNGCEETAPVDEQQMGSACSGLTEAECVAPCQKVASYRSGGGFDFIECSGNENGGGAAITCALPPDRSQVRVFPSTLIPRQWVAVDCNSGICGFDASVVNSIIGTNPDEVPAMTGSTSAPPCCTLEDCSDPDAVCFLGHCTNEPPGPCEDGTCNEGKGCAQNLQAHCDGCSDYSGCVQPSVCELINGEPCTLGPVAMDAQAPDPVDGSSTTIDPACAEAAVDVEYSGNSVWATLGCQGPQLLPDECNDSFGLDRPECPWAGSEPISPEDLPCGSCSDESYLCSVGVWAACDCDPNGSGEITLDSEYWDEWGCMCLGGTWHCLIISPSGASCSNCATLGDAGP
jgi:hypothetical protein